MIFKIRSKLLHCLNSPFQVVNFTIHCLLLRCLKFYNQQVVLKLIHLLLNHWQPNFVFLLIIVLQCRTRIFGHVIILLLNFQNSCLDNKLFLFWRNFLSIPWMPCQVLNDQLKCLPQKFFHNDWLIRNYKQKQHMT